MLIHHSNITATKMNMTERKTKECTAGSFEILEGITHALEKLT